MVVVFLKLFFQRCLYPIVLLLWMLIKKQLDTLMLQAIIHVIDYKALDATPHLV